MYKIAVTLEEKRDVALYWERMRKIAEKIRDDYDRPNEISFHKNFMSKISKNKYRPDFMEPLYIKKN
jgi:hypothetical protein|tara:strand:+ start:2651 stop:2851 length:201 start_codon:yes stop_codon:yes gene_type:complete